MLATEDGDLEVQLSSKSQPERSEKKKVTFQFLEDADDVDFAQAPGLLPTELQSCVAHAPQRHR